VTAPDRIAIIAKATMTSISVNPEDAFNGKTLFVI